MAYSCPMYSGAGGYFSDPIIWGVFTIIAILVAVVIMQVMHNRKVGK